MIKKYQIINTLDLLINFHSNDIDNQMKLNSTMAFATSSDLEKIVNHENAIRLYSKIRKRYEK